MILGFRNDCIIDGTVRLVRLEVFEIDGIIQLGGEIRRTGNEKSLLAIELHSVDLFFMGHEILDHFTRFRRIQSNVTIVHTDKQMLVQSSPSNIGRIDTLGVLWNVNLHDGSGIVRLDIVDTNLGIVFHKGI